MAEKIDKTIHENLAALRFSVRKRFLIKILAQAEPRFCVSAPLFARKRSCRKGECGARNLRCALFTGLPKKICASKDFLGRGGAAVRVGRFVISKTLTSKGVRRRARREKTRRRAFRRTSGFLSISRKFVSSLLKQISSPFRNLCKSKNRAFCFCTSQRSALPRER